MRKALFLASFALAGLVSFNAAAADELGEPGQLALGAERVFGLNFYSQTQKPDQGDETKTSGTAIGLIFNRPVNVYTTPRLAIDYFVADGINVGGSIGYVSTSGTSKTGDDEGDLPTSSGFVIAPRAGYVIPVSDGADFWIKGGFTYFNLSSEFTEPVTDTTTENTESGFGLNIEGAFVLSPIAGFGFFIGPTIDVGLSGTQERKVTGADTQSQDVTSTNIGVNGGLVGWF